MSLRSLFAQNLRQLSATKKSHAHVARALDINRQQFNNYITGKNLPNETVVAKICNYFKVTEAHMFRSIGENSFSKDLDGLADRHKFILGSFIQSEKSRKKRPFSNGLYYIHFANTDADLGVICSLIAIRQENGICTFRRLTRNLDKNNANILNLRGFHYGIASINQNRLSILGVDRFDEYAITLLTGTPVVSAKILYGGIAAVSTGTDFKHVPFVISAAKPGASVRDALKQATVYPASSTLLDESVSHYLAHSLNLYRAAQPGNMADR